MCIRKKLYKHTYSYCGLSWWLNDLKKKSTCNAGDTEDVGQEDPLEEDMVTHSSILAGKIPWTKEHGRPLSMGLRRVGHNCSDWPPLPWLLYYCWFLLPPSALFHLKSDITFRHCIKALIHSLCVSSSLVIRGFLFWCNDVLQFPK